MRLGYPEVILRSGGEPSIRAFVLAVGERLKVKNVRVIPNISPKGDSSSAGSAEVGIRMVKEKVRALICFAREQHGVTIGPDHAMTPWAVRFAAQIITRSHVGRDGLAAWRRAFGRRQLPRRFVPWGEKVLFLPAGKAKAQLEPKWREGIFVGTRDLSEEAVIATPEGIVHARSVRRLPADEACDGVLFNSVVGLPWCLRPADENKDAAGEVAIRLSVFRPPLTRHHPRYSLTNLASGGRTSGDQ